MLDLQKLINDATAAIVEVDALIANPDTPNKDLLNGVRTGLETTMEYAEALQRREADAT